MGILLALAAAFLWGTADFLARFSTQRIGTYRTSFLVQCVGLASVTLYFAVLAFHGFDALASGWRPWAWVVLAGAINSLCSLAFYRAIETGAVSVVAPISSSYPVLTVMLSLLSGERLRWINGIGIAIVLIGVVFASTSFEQPASRSVQETAQPAHHSMHLSERHLARGVAWAITAAVGFGFMFWILGFRVVPVLGGLTSVWMIRLVSLLSLSVLSFPAGQSLALPKGLVWWFVLGTGIFDTAAFLCNNIALAIGQVSIVTVLVSLYSAVTVLYAWIFLRERLERSQWCGIALIFAGIFLVNL